ncbi:hypothetical protein OGATHE_001399 [Ogataea polymorpha]|uniref:Uncharacterized protein n=1 Tax=Ogataea polymorpha TaxID=460523 RepID=A0A9P8TFI3_9ASCO|nr:hypothetical protein OGATHE_001399 [Ogataea polymorpha]
MPKIKYSEAAMSSLSMVSYMISVNVLALRITNTICNEMKMLSNPMVFPYGFSPEMHFEFTGQVRSAELHGVLIYVRAVARVGPDTVSSQRRFERLDSNDGEKHPKDTENHSGI